MDSRIGNAAPRIAWYAKAPSVWLPPLFPTFTFSKAHW